MNNVESIRILDGGDGEQVKSLPKTVTDMVSNLQERMGEMTGFDLEHWLQELSHAKKDEETAREHAASSQVADEAPEKSNIKDDSQQKGDQTTAEGQHTETLQTEENHFHENGKDEGSEKLEESAKSSDETTNESLEETAESSDEEDEQAQKEAQDEGDHEDSKQSSWDEYGKQIRNQVGGEAKEAAQKGIDELKEKGMKGMVDRFKENQ